ncbi:MAG: ribose-5-phosphate isomerase RpiA [Chloroflexi bacterium]|nr:ribose-5-phosphate isomerase RpiA [Chloroflexota bacterium]
MHPSTPKDANVERLKEQAAAEAVKYVQSGMVVGLGTGSTARYAIELIGEALQRSRLRDIIGIPTSEATAALARRVGIPLSTLAEHPRLDLTIDGADEVDPHLNLIKGMGGALLREKIVAAATSLEIIVVDDSKLVDVLGMRSPLPVEVVPFGLGTYEDRLRSLGADPILRLANGRPYVTDNGNYLYLCHFARIDNPYLLERDLNLIPGVIENGLFLDLTHRVIVASAEGIRTLERAKNSVTTGI